METQACPRSDRESTCPRRLGTGNHRLKSAEKACGLRRPLCWEDLVWQPHCAVSPPWARCACLPRHRTRRGTGRPARRNTSRSRRNSGPPPPQRHRSRAVPTDQTPTNKNDCLTVSQILYGRAEALSKRGKQAVPREFTRVASNLDESCGEEDFEKARISIDWMNTCLANYTKDYSLGFCTRDKSYFCAINPRSDACLQSQ